MRIKIIQQIIDKIRGKKYLCQTGNNVDIRSPFDVSKDSFVGNYSYIGYQTRVIKTNIGNYCSIGDNIIIGAPEHNYKKFSTSHFFANKDRSWYEQLTTAPCTIQNDVWIGSHAIIKRGVKIGNGAVIGANAFVSKDVPSYAIVGGVPAKIIKYRFDKETIEKLEKSQWWNLSPENAQKVVDALHLNLEEN